MTDIPITHSTSPKLGQSSTYIAWAVLIGLALFFIGAYALRYYFNYDEMTFRKYWDFRFGLLLHITGGVLALLTAPWQFWSGPRRYRMQVHRWIGRIFLGGVAMGVMGALYLSLTSALLPQPGLANPGAPRWAQAFGLFVLAVVWASTAAMAYYAIRRRRIDLHREWMIRAYVVTFAFVTFRVFADFGPTSEIVPRRDLAITLFWACWALPLFVTELVLQVRKIRRISPAE